METIETFNQRLLDRLGRELDGRARYRIVFADDQTEIRIGEFNEFYGKIFVRTYRGAKEVPKYPAHKGCWILERLCYYPNPELPAATSGSYEPVWVFRDVNEKPYRPFWKAIEFVVYCIEHPQKLTMKDYEEMEREAEEKEVQDYREMLDDQGRSPLFAFENTAVISKTDFWER